ncbi:MAG: DUF1844 domain-containing protein [Planctomycetota bacterium]|jgi:hypothetical protein|nr:DUF1844 domain-containing protein [Planctomycetota bacterium]
MTETETPTDFRLFSQKLALQGFYALGILDVPGAPKQDQPNLQAAKMVIDDLMLLREKTEGNLTDGEQMTLDKFISDLQFQYLEVSKSTET